MNSASPNRRRYRDQQSQKKGKNTPYPRNKHSEKESTGKVNCSLIESLLQQKTPFHLHIPFLGYEDDLQEELQHKSIQIFGRLGQAWLTEPLNDKLLWSESSWLRPEAHTVSSVREAAEILKSRKRDWGHFAINNHRRAELIQQKLIDKVQKPLRFLKEVPGAKHSCGHWSLLSENLLLFSELTTSVLAPGLCHFKEDREDPPSRAYLKLWELFTIHGIRPQSGEKCMDVGCAPGGWTWVLSELGCPTIAVDKAPLAEKLMHDPNIDYRRDSAFGLRPQHIGELDWFFSDIICYPEKLLQLVQRFHQSGLVKNFVCTVKFQKHTDWDVLQQLCEIPNSQLIHLHHNKHECTWISLNSQSN